MEVHAHTHTERKKWTHYFWEFLMLLDSFLNKNYPLFTYDKNILFELKNWAYNSSRNYKVIVKDIISMRAKAHEVIEALKKEYLFE